MCLPSSVRLSLLSQLYTHRGGGGQLTRSEYFQLLSSAWSLLYSPDWTEVSLPDTQELLQARRDIRTDSPSALEDLHRVMRRLGMVTTSTTSTSSISSSPHMRHSDLYTAILRLLLSSQPSQVRVLRLRAYTRTELYTGAERLLVTALITQLELGHAVSEEILQEVGRSCRQVRKLKISGPAVTDTGLGLLCSEGSQSGLCLSLASLSVLATTSLTLEAVLLALHHLRHLTHLSLQDNLLLQILRNTLVHSRSNDLNQPMRA